MPDVLIINRKNLYKYTKYILLVLAVVFTVTFSVSASRFSPKISQALMPENAVASQSVQNTQAPSQNSVKTAVSPTLNTKTFNGTGDPVTLKIPSIGLVAPIVKTGLETDGSLHVPSSPELTGWYDLGPRPGDTGPAVITGHLDSAAGPGILWNLHKAQAGDEVDVVRDDGSIAVFRIDSTALYSQDNFNTQAVYGSIPNAGLRIITCAGTYSRATGHYSDDLVVYGSLVRIEQQGTYQPL